MTDLRAAPGQLTWRPFRPQDAPAVADMLAAAEVVDQTDENVDAEDITEQLVNDLVDLDADTRVVWDGDEVVAMGEVSGQTQVRDVHNVWCGGAVRPTHRRGGIGRRLLAWQLDRGAALHAATHPQAPANVSVDVGAVNPGLHRLVRAESLNPVRSWFDMGRGLDGALPVPQPIRGITLLPYDVGRDEEVRAAHTVTFRGHFGSTDRTPEEWRQYFTGSRAFRPELSLLAVVDEPGGNDAPSDNGQIAGYLLSYVYDADVAVNGRREVYLGQLGTLPRYRGRGIGSALLASAFTDWAVAGHEYACLGVDSENGTGALGLYQRAGMSVVKTWVSWARQIPAAHVESGGGKAERV